ERPVLTPLARLVGAMLSQAGYFAAALAHLKLAASLSDKEQESSSSIRIIESNGSVAPWLKNPYTLSEAPEGLSTSQRDQFNQALGWAKTGLWSSAASAFEMLSTEAAATVAADRNLGLCRLWMADDSGASEAFARYVARLGTTLEAVDFEALRQSITEVGPDDQVEHVQLIWPVRDRETLLKALRNDPTVEDFGSGPIDPEDPESPQVDQFGLLDRPVIREPKAGLKPDDIPRFVSRIHVGQEIVALEAYDDGRLDGLVDRFTSIVQGGIPPAHPKTKVLEKIAKATLALSWEWRLPEDLDDSEAERLDREQGSWIIREGWSQTPMPFLNGKTPLEAAKAGNAQVPLRAAVLRLEQTNDTSWDNTADFAS
ncbi:SEC-C domain-containing protein, partial [Singulisphaera rosea]